MKKIILMLAAISMVAAANAQFSVNSAGNSIVSSNVNNINSNYKLTVEAEKNGVYILNDAQVLSDTYGLYVDNHLKQGTGTNSAICAKAIYYSNHSVDKTLNPRAYGVQAVASRGNKNFGVSGIILDSGPGAGIYGGTSGAGAGDNVTGCYAGYFDGSTKIDGSLTVTYGVYSPAYTITRNSQNGMSVSAMEIGEDESNLDRLSSVGLLTVHQSEDAIKNSPQDSVMAAQSLTKNHYAIDAEALENAFPDLVYELQDGQKAINYTELIPVLVQCINELGQEVRTLKGENAMMARGQNAATGIGEVEDTDIISLSQNDPNPWSTQTAIRMNIPERVRDAAVFIYDMSGKQLAEHRISGRGDTSLTLTADSLLPGMYIYTLIADGKVISTKRMILTK